MTQLYIPGVAHPPVLTGNALVDFRAELTAAAGHAASLRLSTCRYIRTFGLASYSDSIQRALHQHLGKAAEEDVYDAVYDNPSIDNVAEYNVPDLVLLLNNMESVCIWMDYDLLDELIGQFVDPSKARTEADLVNVAKIVDRFISTHPSNIPTEIFSALERISTNENASKEIKFDNIKWLLENRTEPVTEGIEFLMARVAVRSVIHLVPYTQYIVSKIGFGEEVRKSFLISLILATAGINQGQLSHVCREIKSVMTDAIIQQVFVKAATGLVGDKTRCKAILDALKTAYAAAGGVPNPLNVEIVRIEGLAGMLDTYMTHPYTDAAVFISTDANIVRNIEAIADNINIPIWIRRVILLKFMRHRFKDYNYDVERSLS